MLFQEANNSLALLVEMLWTLPCLQLFYTGKQLRQFSTGHCGMRCVIAREHEARDRAPPDEIARDTEDEVPAPHVSPEALYRRIIKLGPRCALLLCPCGMALRKIFWEFRVQPYRVLQDRAAHALRSNLAELEAVA